MSSFLNRLFGTSAPDAAPSSQPAAGAAAKPSRAESAARPAAAHTDNSTSTNPPGAESLESDLRNAVSVALEGLDMELSDQRKSSDIVLLLHALRDNSVSGVRQLPIAAQRALKLLHRDAPTAQLVALFEKDPAMTQALLQQVNSAYYNPTGGRVGTLGDACTRMGRAGIQSVVMQQTVAGMVSRPGGELDEMAQQVWNHMVRVAPIARGLAPVFGASPDLAFLLGLMHDVGKLVVFDRITELRSAQRRLLVLDSRIVARMMRVLHEPFGGLLIQQWGLDAEITRAVASHHREPAPSVRDPLCETVYLAERVDLLRERKETPDLAAIWSSGALTGDMAAAAARLEVSTEAAA